MDQDPTFKALLEKALEVLNHDSDVFDVEFLAGFTYRALDGLESDFKVKLYTHGPGFVVSGLLDFCNLLHRR